MRTLGLLIAISLISGACAKQVSPQNGTAFARATPAAPGAPVGVATTPVPSMGTINGGGGIGIRCNGKLEMLDLYEARAAGLTLVKTPTSREEAIALVARVFSDHYWNIETIPRDQHAAILARDLIAPIFDGQPFLNYQTNQREGVDFVDELPLSNDLGAYTLPAGCRLEQVAYFSDAKTQLSIVKSAWADLDWLSKSILNAHELNYMIDRREGLQKLRKDHGPNTSESTRRFVGRLFTVESVPVMIAGLPSKDKVWTCATLKTDEKVATYFYLFDGNDGARASLILKTVRGHSSFYQMRADFATLTASGLTAKAEADVAEATKLKLSGSGSKSDFTVVVERKASGDPTIAIHDVRGAADAAVGEPQPFTCEPAR